MKVVLAFVVLIWMLAATAEAQPVTGFYVQGSAGLAFAQQHSLTQSPAPPASSETSGSETSAAAGANAAINGTGGAVQSGSAGWGFGDGFRMEVEGIHAAQGAAPGN
jgi:hypothetical protein